MAEQSYDCIVIGSGPGGYVAAIRASQLGMSTAVVEKNKIGGRCLNYACIPAKAVLRSADIISEINHAEEFGIKTGEATIDFSAVGKRREEVISTLTGGVSGLMSKNKIDVIEGIGSITEDGNVRVKLDSNDEGTVYATKNVIIATGSVATPIPGIEFGNRVINTARAWALPALPKSLAVVGAGASGAEIASAYSRLGTEVLLLEALDSVLPTEDKDISRVVARGLKKQGIDVQTGVRVENVEASKDSVKFSYSDSSAEVDYLCIAAGRRPDIEQLNLEAAKIELESNGLIKVNDSQQTSRPGIYAIGDTVHGPALAHKASDEGVIAAEAAAGQETHPLVHENIPRATFCEPNVASFGLTEQQAKDAGHDVVVGKLSYGAVGAGTVYGDKSGLVKIVGDKKYGEILGGHIVGVKATELISELVTAQSLEGGYAEVARVVHGHPTLSEAVMEAARAADGWLIHG